MIKYLLLAFLTFTAQARVEQFDAQVVMGDRVLPAAASLLQLNSTEGGLGFSRLTTAQRDAIPTGNLIEGLTIYNSDTDTLDTWNGTTWVGALGGVGGNGTDNCLARWDGTGSPLLQDSGVCVDDSGDLQYTAGSGTGLDIFANTVDASDTGAATFSGGGTSDRSRGSSLRVYGNEHPSSNAGDLNIGLGGVAGSQFGIFCADNTLCSNVDGATGAHTFGKSASPASHTMYGNLAQSSTADITQTITTSGASNGALLDITVEPGGADAGIRYNTNGTQSYTMGIDNSVSDRWAMSYNNTLGTADWLTVDASGNVSILNSVIGQTGATPSTNTVFEVVSTSKGSIPCPKMTEAQRDAITSPQQGQCVYNTSKPVLNVYNGTSWVSAGGGLNKWAASTNYKTDDVVWLADDNKIYRALSDFTSGATFNPANWQELSDDVNSTGTITNNHIVRYDGTTGKLIQESGLELTDAGNIRHTNGDFNIGASTADASDTSNTSLWGGGGAGITRGSGLSVYGNEHATYPGVVRLKTGDAAGGKLSVECNGTECLAASNAGAVSIGATGGTQTHTVNGNLDVLGEGDITVNSANPALTLVQNGAGYALNVTGVGVVTGSLAVDNITVNGNEISSTNTDGNISLNPNGAGEVVKIDGNGNSLILGVNPDKRQLLLYPSFEESIAEGSCSGCTATQEPTIKLGTAKNTASLKMAFSAATGSYTIDKTTSAEYNATQVVGGCWIKTSASGVKFHVRSNGANILEHDVSDSDTWEFYDIPFVAGTTSVGYRVEASSSITDDVYVDECTLGASEDNKLVLNGAEYVGSYHLSGAANCSFSTASTSFADMGADADCGTQAASGGISSPSTKKLAIASASGTFKAGVYNVKHNNSASNFTTAATSTCRLAAGTTYSNEVLFLNRDGSTGDYFNNQDFTLALDNNYTGEISLECKVSSGTLNFAMDATPRNADFQVYYIPNFGSSGASANTGSNVRLDTANGYGSTATKIRRFTNQRVNIGSGIKYADSAADGASFTAKKSGFYFISYIDKFSAISWLGISLNSASLTTSIDSLAVPEVLTASTTSSADAAESVSWIGWLSQGDVVRAHTNGSAVSGGSVQTSFSIVSFSDLIIGLFKDVVTSPGSSNGKPVVLNNKIDASEVITSPLGDSLFISSCTDAVPSVCTLDTTVIQGSPECWSQGASSYVSAASSTTVTVERAANTTPFSLFCKGLQP